MADRVYLASHPSRNKNGEPLFPALRSIIADGYGMVGYTGDPPLHNVQFINWQASQEAWIIEAVKRLVEAEFGCQPDQITSVMEPQEIESEDEDD